MKDGTGEDGAREETRPRKQPRVVLMIAVLIVLGTAISAGSYIYERYVFSWDAAPESSIECSRMFTKHYQLAREAEDVVHKACSIFFREGTTASEKRYLKCLLTGIKDCKVKICVQELSDECARKHGGG